MPININPAGEARDFIRNFDINKDAGIQPEEINRDFVVAYLNKSADIQQAIEKNLSKESVAQLSLILALIAAGQGPANLSSRIIEKAKAIVKFKRMSFPYRSNDPKAPRYAVTDTYIPLNKTGEDSRLPIDPDARYPIPRC
ncbi:MAG: hypothetical protein PHG97_04755 [Candidatus Margulisbacteria bacterium]|nr:hypothetical protein [Candidatus Margulisiibacteriota bacterium]